MENCYSLEIDRPPRVLETCMLDEQQIMQTSLLSTPREPYALKQEVRYSQPSTRRQPSTLDTSFLGELSPTPLSEISTTRFSVADSSRDPLNITTNSNILRPIENIQIQSTRSIRHRTKSPMVKRSVSKKRITRTKSSRPRAAKREDFARMLYDHAGKCKQFRRLMSKQGMIKLLQDFVKFGDTKS